MEEKYKILALDDDSEVLKLINNVLKDTYTCILMKKAQDALDYLIENKIDLILSDVEMEEMDGYEFLQNIKKNDKLDNIPFIFLTSKTDLDSEVKGIELGAIDFVHKPIDPRRLLARINRHIGQDRQRRIFATYTKDVDLVFTECSSKYAKYLGFEDEKAIIGHRGISMGFVSLIVNEEDEKKVLNGSSQTILGQIYDRESEDIKLIDTHIAPIRDDLGNILGIQGIIYLVETERQLKEKIMSINEKNANLRRIIENAGLIVVNFTYDDSICYFITDNISEYGHNMDSIIGNKIEWLEFIYEEELVRIRELLNEAVEENESHIYTNVTIYNKKLENFNMRCSLHITYVSDNIPISVEIVMVLREKL